MSDITHMTAFEIRQMYGNAFARPEEPIHFAMVDRMIGDTVPVPPAQAITHTIKVYLEECAR